MKDKIREIVVISGKGGTGKTSITASFAALAESPVMVDCDVDAADLHLVLKTEVLESHEFHGGKLARILEESCRHCGICTPLCRFKAISPMPTIDKASCEGCGVCAHFCPHGAILFEEALNGHWYRSRTRFGPLFHARLGVAEENSGKLVALIRKEARAHANEEERRMILVDGPPGIGCPVIASLSGADQVVIVTEPTVSGIHDLKRVADLARHFRVPANIVINKADLNSNKAREIADFALANDLRMLGEVPYEPAITKAQIAEKSVVEFSDGPASEAIRKIWQILSKEKQ
ncbi:MAG TPA: ATP-binding protein [Chroococcales cyanobacterium]|jgi:MinD superfamily P-loop ATPase